MGLVRTNQPLAVEFQVGVQIPTFRLTPVAAHTEREKMRTLMKIRRLWSRVRITNNVDPTVSPMNTATVSPMSGNINSRWHVIASHYSIPVDN